MRKINSLIKLELIQLLVIHTKERDAVGFRVVELGATVGVYSFSGSAHSRAR